MTLTSGASGAVAVAGLLLVRVRAGGEGAHRLHVVADGVAQVGVRDVEGALARAGR